ncbi:hypothetical protein G6L37_03295 [Agrobacterium rubi]|nr:hypothetical protein [Agrobacterium rubi]NTF24401.1 hypothetical protein [Agrobacterium rubi]
MPKSERFIDLAFERLDLGFMEIELDAKAEDKVYLHHFRSAFPSEGNARDAMKIFFELADSEGITLMLFAKAESGERYLTQQQLESWYERLGFDKGDYHGFFERHPRREMVPK